MKFNIETLSNNSVIINSKIIATNHLSIPEVCQLIEEYEESGVSGFVYTADAMEMKWGHPGLLKNNFERIDKGGVLGYMADTIEKISKHLCVLKESTLIQVGELKQAV